MKILENLSPVPPIRTFTLHLDAREMDVLARCLEFVMLPFGAHDIRTQFKDISTKITLANNSNDGA